MPRGSRSPLPDLGAWQVEGLRLTAFRPPGATEPDPGLWRDVIGSDPEFQSSKPKVGERVEAGPFGEGKLFLQVQPSRLDWVFVAEPDEKERDALLRSFPAMLEIFSAPMAEWLNRHPATNRLAFGASLRLPIANRDEGYAKISEFLPFSINPKTSTDFLYQINRPTESSIIEKLTINRLSKWSVGLLVRQMIQIDPEGQPTAHVLPGDEHCRLELDINTSGNFQGYLPSDRLTSLFDELVEFGRAIVREGDRET